MDGAFVPVLQIMSKHTKIRQLIAEYEKENPGPIKARDIAAWLYFGNRMRPAIEESVDILAREVSDAMRSDTYTDPDGRKVRRKHAVRYKDTAADGTKQWFTFWYDIELAPFGFMETSFGQRRMAIADTCWQLHQDEQSYNKYHNKVQPIQTYFNFTDDMLDRETDLNEGGES